METAVTTVAIVLGVIVSVVVLLVIGGIVLNAITKGWSH